jgi:hypothetical protein
LPRTIAPASSSFCATGALAGGTMRRSAGVPAVLGSPATWTLSVEVRARLRARQIGLRQLDLVISRSRISRAAAARRRMVVSSARDYTRAS